MYFITTLFHTKLQSVHKSSFFIQFQQIYEMQPLLTFYCVAILVQWCLSVSRVCFSRLMNNNWCQKLTPLITLTLTKVVANSLVLWPHAPPQTDAKSVKHMWRLFVGAGKLEVVKYVADFFMLYLIYSVNRSISWQHWPRTNGN